MAENTEYIPLPADLPEDWTPGQIVAPAGADVGLSVQHGYNYLNAQVNAAQRAANRLQEEKASKEEVDAIHGLPAGGTAGQVLTKTGEEDGQAGWQNAVASFNGRTGAVQPAPGDYSVSQVTGAAPSASPVFTGSISLGRKAETTKGTYSFAGGSDVEASGSGSHAEGYYTKASGGRAHAGGLNSTASGSNSFAHGDSVIAAMENQVVIGRRNIESSNFDDMFIIGNGPNVNMNCFRVTGNGGVYAKGSYHSSGADYAELFEWADGNPDRQDRAGLFVTLQGDKIRPAPPDDDYILGVVSGSPSVAGDVYDDQWAGMFLTDIFDRPIYEDVDLPAELGPGGEEILPARTERRQKLNPAYDHTKKYLPRTQRPEWDAVGLLGKLVAVDDGTCVPDGWCTVGPGGMATASKERTEYRVMARLDESHVRVMIL